MYHDAIQDYFYIANKRTGTRINDNNIKQIYKQNVIFVFGKTQKEGAKKDLSLEFLR